MCVLLASMIVPAFGILAALGTVLLTALIAGFMLRPRVRIRGSLPESVVVGQTVQFGYELENVARMSAYELTVELDSLPASIERLDESPIVSRLGPGAKAEVAVNFKAHRRGRFLIPAPVCRSSFPFNMFVFGLSREGRQSLLVLPPVFPMRLPLQDRATRADLTGSGLAGRTEVSPEYAGNRPFVAGDSPRRIDVRAWARLSVPATKEYYTTQDRLAVLVLDSRLHGLPKADADPSQPFEAAVCLCASTAAVLDQDCLIDAVAIGPTLHRFSQMPRTDRFNAIHHMLATVEPLDGYDLEPIHQGLDDQWRHVSEAVFILLTWDRMYGRLIEQAARAGCRTTVLLVSEPVDKADRSNTACFDAGSAVWARQTAVLSPRDVLEGRIGDL
jgi:hypothetical protein